MTDTERTDTHTKGDRHERQAVRILSSRYRAERVPSIYGNNDPFRLADVMGLRANYPFALIQVKTNRFSNDQKQKYRRWSRDIDGRKTIFEVWVRYDRQGWEMYRLDPETQKFTTYFGTKTCDPKKVRLDWRECFDESLVTGENGCRYQSVGTDT